MTDTAYTGLGNPYGAYRQFAGLIHLSALVIIKGCQEPYAERAARRVWRAGFALARYAQGDVSMQIDKRRLLSDLEASVRYLKKCQTLDNALPEFKECCRVAERDAADLINALGGSWPDRMFPIFRGDNDG